MKTILFILLIFLCSCSPVLIPQFRGDCVDRAVEIRNYLKSQGYECEIIMGRTKLNGKIVAHAWIEYKLKDETKWKRYDNWSAVSDTF